MATDMKAARQMLLKLTTADHKHFLYHGRRARAGVLTMYSFKERKIIWSEFYQLYKFLKQQLYGKVKSFYKF